jgi:hypothetical protein
MMLETFGNNTFGDRSILSVCDSCLRLQLASTKDGMEHELDRMDRILGIHLRELVALALVAPHAMQFSDIHEHAIITLGATVSLMPLLRRSLQIALLQCTSSLRISRVSGLVVPGRV